MSFDSTAILTTTFLERLDSIHAELLGAGTAIEYRDAARAVAAMAVETIERSDAFYHDVEHTMLVTLVGQEILRGRALAAGRVSASDWLHFTVGLLCHDIGYVRGICPGDGDDVAVTGFDGDSVTIPAGATDAFLTPYHIERGQLFVRTQFADHPLIDGPLVAAAIEYTRFPVPANGGPSDAADWAVLVQAADLIGQLADTDYPRKLPALYYEFEETGANARMGNSSPDSLRDSYPEFFWTMVREHIEPGIRCLQRTRAGRDWLASLYAHVFSQEQKQLEAGAAAAIHPGLQQG